MLLRGENHKRFGGDVTSRMASCWCTTRMFKTILTHFGKKIYILEQYCQKNRESRESKIIYTPLKFDKQANKVA